MRLPLHIAKRYLIAKKSHNAINVISAISVIGVAVVTMALVIILSVYNGFDKTVHSLFQFFDAELTIYPSEGKSFNGDDPRVTKVRNLNTIKYSSAIVEENVLLKYRKKQTISIIKGVESDYVKISQLDSAIVQGKYILQDKNTPYAVVGQGVSQFLGIGLAFFDRLNFYVPNRSGKLNIMNPSSAFNQDNLYPSGIFGVEKNFDSKYVIVPISFARSLLGYTNEVSSVEMKVNDNADIEDVKEEIQTMLGPDFVVKDRYEIRSVAYKLLKTEKWAIFFILAFILLLASTNVVGSLTMLILEKRNDIKVLNSMGANKKLIHRIFFTEGWLISIIGAVIGIVLGFIICWLQQTYGLIHLKGSESFVLDAYPVEMIFTDFIYIFGVVLFIGFAAAWYPVKYLINRFLGNIEI